MPPPSFRRKVLLLALALVLVIQCVTVFPVLGALRRDSDEQARRSVRLAGVVFGEFIRNRQAELQTAADVLVGDYGFKKAVAVGDRATIQSALANHAARIGADVAILFNLDGKVVASSFDSAAGGKHPAARGAMPDTDERIHAVTYFDGVPFETVTVPVMAPIAVARVMLGFRIDERLAEQIRELTGLQTSFIRVEAGRPAPVASTLAAAERPSAIAGLSMGAQEPETGARFVSIVKPFLDKGAGLQVALQLPIDVATQSYRKIRDILLAILGISVLLAVAGAGWLGRAVTRPVQTLASAARRMREGIYTETVEVESSDELGELAAGFNAMQAAIADRERRIYHIAHHDSLSGLPNRELTANRLRETLESEAEAEAQAEVAVVNLALSRFNGIISSLGHAAADEVIQLAAQLLRNRLDAAQFIGHLNRDEFVLILPGCDAERAVACAQQMTEALRSGVRLSGGGANVSLQATAGIACFPEHAGTARELLQCASSARNDAEIRYEPVVVYRPERQDRAKLQMRMVGDFLGALKEEQFLLYWQPKLDCRTRQIYGAEALVRWRHPALGLLAPDAFIEAIEQVGGIGHLTRWVLAAASAQCAQWQSDGWALSVAVNLSVDDLMDQYLPYYLLELVRRYRLRPADITLEVTESAIMHNVQMSLSVIECLRELNFRIAMDDFGTGHSALAQLKRLPVDELKIDKSFVMSMESSEDEAIVRAVVELGHQLDLSVVSEGVEDERTLERLRILGCEYAQGFYIGRPRPEREFRLAAEDWAARHAGGGRVLV